MLCSKGKYLCDSINSKTRRVLSARENWCSTTMPLALDYFVRNSCSGGALGAFTRLFIRFFQFLLAITVAGLYGVDLHNANKANKYTDAKWVFAEVVAGLSAVTVLVYCIPVVLRLQRFWAAWDLVLFILWASVLGVFGSIYIGAKPSPQQGGQRRMKNAVWVDLTNMLLWLVTTAYGIIIWLRASNTRTLHTGRAKV